MKTVNTVLVVTYWAVLAGASGIALAKAVRSSRWNGRMTQASLFPRWHRWLTGGCRATKRG